MNERSFSLVLGYLPNIDDTYAPASRLSLNKRFAIALNTYRSSKDEMYFDSEMLLKIVKDILPIFPHDTISVLFDSKKIRIKNIENLNVEDLVNSVEENDPFVRLEVLLNNNIICLVNVECYTAIGGPIPYHDTYTFSFYSDDYSIEELLTRIKGIVETEGYYMERIVYGKDQPEISLLSKLKLFFK